ncbi:universal stress protein [Streptomyces sp. NPDC053513]|uniref:universal stress protein n=1 Tax=unclassified Streptomyces TaxID=2593676 RepID=UPI0037D935D4
MAALPGMGRSAPTETWPALLSEGRNHQPEVLTAAADESDLTVLGSRGLGGVRGFLVGSVSLAVVGTARRPVVLVRAEGAPAAFGDGIVVGVDVHQPCDALLAFSFNEAARRETPLGFLHSWTLPASYGYAAVIAPGSAMSRAATSFES